MSYSYDAYGHQKIADMSAGTYNPLGYGGQYTDPSNLVYLRARYYDPATQQFITRDPMVAKTGQPFDYCSGNPINNTDPTGQEPIFDWAFFGWDVTDIGSNGLNWGNRLALAGDIASLALPVDDMLSPGQRASVIMRYYLDWSDVEVSRKLDIPAGTVRRRLHDARQRLRRLLPT